MPAQPSSTSRPPRPQPRELRIQIMPGSGSESEAFRRHWVCTFVCLHQQTMAPCAVSKNIEAEPLQCSNKQSMLITRRLWHWGVDGFAGGGGFARHAPDSVEPRHSRMPIPDRRILPSALLHYIIEQSPGVPGSSRSNHDDIPHRQSCFVAAQALRLAEKGFQPDSSKEKRATAYASTTNFSTSSW